MRLHMHRASGLCQSATLFPYLSPRAPGTALGGRPAFMRLLGSFGSRGSRPSPPLPPPSRLGLLSCSHSTSDREKIRDPLRLTSHLYVCMHLMKDLSSCERMLCLPQQHYSEYSRVYQTQSIRRSYTMIVVQGQTLKKLRWQCCRNSIPRGAIEEHLWLHV